MCTFHASSVPPNTILEGLKLHQPEDDRDPDAPNDAEYHGIGGSEHGAELLIHLCRGVRCQQLAGPQQGSRGQQAHRDTHEHEENQSGPNPAMSPPVAHEAKDDTGQKQHQQGDPPKDAHGLGEIEQSTDAFDFALATQLEGDRGSGAMCEQKSEYGQDVHVYDPLIEHDSSFEHFASAGPVTTACQAYWQRSSAQSQDARLR